MAAAPVLIASDNNKPNRAADYSQHMFWIRSLLLSTNLDDDGSNQSYAGSGTHEDPYVVDYMQNDRQDAMSFTKARKWTIALCQAISFFAVTFGSSVYASGIPQIILGFHVSEEVAILGLALYVLGFAIGPILWAPMSEVYGRRLTFMVSYSIYIAFTVAAPATNSITALLLLRFFASAFGSSAQINPGGMIADMFCKEERGLAMGVFAASPFLGPAIGTSWLCLFLLLSSVLVSGIFADPISRKVPSLAVLLLKQRAGVGFLV